METTTAILIGAGDRGAKAYASYALDHPNELNIIAVAEPNDEKRKNIKKQHQILEANCFSSWEEILGSERKADVAIICTMDQQHYGPTMKALELGYHVLLEKPMSPNPQECVFMEEQAKEYDRQLTICHVLRYTDFWRTIGKVIAEGTIGEVASLQLNENVEIMHMSHSFVRGNWRNKETSSPMILQKSCHDMDIIRYVLDKKCERISSYGSLLHFHSNNKPEGAPLYCLDGCPAEQTCPFHAGRYYLGEGRNWAAKFTEDTSNEGIIKALYDTNYGKCVYQLNNDVVDHQVVNMEFEGGATATFSMCGFTRDQTRVVQIMGAKGEIRGKMDDNQISVYDFLTKKETVIKFDQPTGGHGGGDLDIIRDFLSDIKKSDKHESISSASISLSSHLMAFAAEESRLNNGVSIELDQFYHKFVGEHSSV